MWNKKFKIIFYNQGSWSIINRYRFTNLKLEKRCVLSQFEFCTENIAVPVGCVSSSGVENMREL